MALLTSSAYWDLFIFGLIVFRILYNYFSRNFGFWERKGLPYVKPKPFFGSFRDVIFFKTNVGLLLQKLYVKMRDDPIFGIWIFDRPALVVRDPLILTKILDENSDSFKDRHVFLNENLDKKVIHCDLYSAKGNKWKNCEDNLTDKAIQKIPTNFFTTFLENNIKEDSHEVDIKALCDDLLFNYLLILSAQYGLQSNSLNKKIRQIQKTTIKKTLKELTFSFAPKLTSIFKLKMHDSSIQEFLNQFKTEEDRQFFHNFLTQAYKPLNNTLIFLLYEFAQNPQIQILARKESKKFFLEQNSNFDTTVINELKYLDKCVKEILRKYPPVTYLNRICTKTWQIPNTKATVDEGTQILVPILGLHHNPKYYENPDKFDPERFSNGKKPYEPNMTYLPFGYGPRTCPSSKFAIDFIKLATVHILDVFEIEKTSKTPTVIKFSKKCNWLQVDKKVLVKLKKI